MCIALLCLEECNEKLGMYCMYVVVLFVEEDEREER